MCKFVVIFNVNVALIIHNFPYKILVRQIVYLKKKNIICRTYNYANANGSLDIYFKLLVKGTLTWPTLFMQEMVMTKWKNNTNKVI